MKVELKYLRVANLNDAIFKTDLASLKCNASSFKMSWFFAGKVACEYWCILSLVAGSTFAAIPLQFYNMIYFPKASWLFSCLRALKQVLEQYEFNPVCCPWSLTIALRWLTPAFLWLSSLRYNPGPSGHLLTYLNCLSLLFLPDVVWRKRSKPYPKSNCPLCDKNRDKSYYLFKAIGDNCMKFC